MTNAKKLFSQYTDKLTKGMTKTEVVLFVIMFAVTWIFFALNTGNVDYSNYAYAYEIFGQGEPNVYFEPGSYGLIMLCISLGLSYQGYLAVVATITLMIFLKAIRLLTDNATWTWAVFMIYPLAFDIVQYRNFLAFAICLYGLHYLLDENVSVAGVIKYVISVLIGMQFHDSMIAYLLLVLIVFKKTKTVAIFSALAFCGVITIAFFGEFLISLLESLNWGDFGIGAFTRYLGELNISTFVQYLAVYLFFMVLALWKFRGEYEGKKFKLLIAVSMLVPLIILSGTAARFFRNMFVVFYAFLLDRKPGRDTGEILRDRMIAVALLCSIVFVFYMQLGRGLYHQTVLLPVLTDNLLFGFGS